MYLIIPLITFFLLSNHLIAQEGLPEDYPLQKKLECTSKGLNISERCGKTFTDEQAIAYYQSILGKNLNTEENQKVILLARLGELFFHRQKYDSAIVVLKTLLDKPPGMACAAESLAVQRASFYLAFSYVRSGETEAGVETLRKQFNKLYTNNDFANVQSFCELCETYGLFLDEAYYWAKKSCEKYGHYLIETQKETSLMTENAERQAADSILNSPVENYYRILNTYGELAGLTNNYSDALHAWQELLGLPDCIFAKIYKPLSKAYIAAVYIKSGESEKGEKLIQEMRHNPGDTTDALFFLPIACAKFRVKIKQAILWAEEGLKLKLLDDNCWLYDAYAELLFEDGQTDKALLWETKAYENLPIRQFKDKIEKYKGTLR